MMKRLHTRVMLTILPLVGAASSIGAPPPRLQGIGFSGTVLWPEWHARWYAPPEWCAWDVKVAGAYAYIALAKFLTTEPPYGDSLSVIDVSNPTNCVRIGGYEVFWTPGGPFPLGANAASVALTGNHAYLLNTYTGLHVIDICDPTNCLRVGGYAGGGQSVVVSSNYAYMVGADGLSIVDVSNSSNCVRVGNIHTGGYELGLTVSGRYAYVADYLAGLEIVDVSDPAACVLVGGYATPGHAQGVTVSGRYAFVADGNLQVIDVTDPGHSVRVGGFDTTGEVTDVAVSGNYAYLAERPRWTGSNSVGGGLLVIDVSDPTHCVLAGRFATDRSTWKVMIHANRIYVADEAGLMILPVFSKVSFTVRVDATPSVPLTLEAATDLSAPFPWTSLLTTNAAAMPFDYVDFDVKLSDKPQKFYRVRQP
jgi:hypothetical protein